MHDDNTIIIIASVSGGVIVLLVVLIVWAKMRLNKAFRRRQAKKKAQVRLLGPLLLRSYFLILWCGCVYPCNS